MWELAQFPSRPLQGAAVYRFREWAIFVPFRRSSRVRPLFRQPLATMTTTATPSIFRCRICARIAAAVFLLLIAIEGLLLIPSTLRFEREILQRIVGEADATFFAALDYANLQSAPGPLGRSIASMTEMLGWRGLTVRNAVGQIIAAAGEPVRTSPAAIHPGRTHVADGLVRIDEGNRIEVAWTQDIRGVPLTFVARLDSSQVTPAAEPRLSGDLWTTDPTGITKTLRRLRRKLKPTRSRKIS